MDDGLSATLRLCCASDTWIAAMVAHWPFDSSAARDDFSSRLVAELPWTDIRQAIDAHPRIGDRVGGVSREASWSRSEQAATADIGADVQQRLVDGNVAYEQRFGHVFLICATGPNGRGHA